MFALLTAFIKDHWLSALAGFVGVFVMAVYGIQHLEIGHLKKKVEECQLESAALSRSNTALMGALSQQNAAVDALAADAAARSKAAAHALKQAQDRARAYAKKAGELKTEKEQNSCDGLRDLIERYTSAAP